jgi:hypothetical protein
MRAGAHGGDQVASEHRAAEAVVAGGRWQRLLDVVELLRVLGRVRSIDGAVGCGAGSAVVDLVGCGTRYRQPHPDYMLGLSRAGERGWELEDVQIRLGLAIQVPANLEALIVG